MVAGNNLFSGGTSTKYVKKMLQLYDRLSLLLRGEDFL